MLSLLGAFALRERGCNLLGTTVVSTDGWVVWSSVVFNIPTGPEQAPGTAFAESRTEGEDFG